MQKKYIFTAELCRTLHIYCRIVQNITYLLHNCAGNYIITAELYRILHIYCIVVQNTTYVLHNCAEYYIFTAQVIYILCNIPGNQSR